MDYKTYERKKVEVSDVDFMNEYQLCHLFNRFAEIATVNAVKIGLWNKEMMDRYGWIVAKQTLKLDCPISLGDEIELSTIAGKGSSAIFPRYYFINKDGKEIGRCSSVWTLIDIQQRRIVFPKRIGLTIPVIPNDRKLKAPETIQEDIELKHIMKRQVLYSDVDTNQHMNNTRYIQWAFDVIDFDIHKDCFVSEISINYKKEIRPLEYVDLYVGCQDHRYIVEGRNEEEIYFLVEIIFSQR